MAINWCLAGIDHVAMPTFKAVFIAAGAPAPATIARLNVPELGKLAPYLLVTDIDALDVDRLEFLRRLRFVLPRCTIAVYTGLTKRTWATDCHLAGANCLLSKDSDKRVLLKGLCDVLQSGCYTDPRFLSHSVVTDPAQTKRDHGVADRKVKLATSRHHEENTAS